MPFVGEIYDAGGGGEWELLSLPHAAIPLYSMKRLSDGFKCEFNSWELANWFTRRTIKVTLPSSVTSSALWNQYYGVVWGLNSTEPMPKIEVHICTYVKYDTGLPNSRVFEYCKGCDKEKT